MDLDSRNGWTSNVEYHVYTSGLHRDYELARLTADGFQTSGSCGGQVALPIDNSHK